MQCPNCKKDIPDTSQFCSFCGQELVPDKIQIAPKEIKERHLPQCPSCKRDVAPTSENCPYCRHKLVPQKIQEEGRHLIKCPKCNRDITRTSEYCPYCGPLNSNGSTDSEEAAADLGVSFMEGLDGCSESIKGCSGNLFQFGCAFTLLMALLAILFFLIFG